MNAAALLGPARCDRAAGTGFVRVSRGPRRSEVCRARATSPLKLLTPRNHGSAAWLYCASYGGGLVNGDDLHVTIEVTEHAEALLSTQASTKVYRSPDGTAVELRATVAAGGLLVLLPDPVVCFAASTYRQRQEVQLAATADLVLVDWLSSGRRAMGERWAFSRYSSRTLVQRDGRTIFLDGLELAAADADSAARMGRFEIVATVVFGGPRVGAHAAAAVEAAATRPLARRAPLVASAAPLGSDGAVLRIAGTSVEQVAAYVREQLRFLPALLGDDPWARKW